MGVIGVMEWWSVALVKNPVLHHSTARAAGIIDN